MTKSPAAVVATNVANAAKRLGPDPNKPLMAYWNLAPEQPGAEYVVFAVSTQDVPGDISGGGRNRNVTIDYTVFAQTAVRAAELDWALVQILKPQGDRGTMQTAGTPEDWHSARRQLRLSESFTIA